MRWAWVPGYEGRYEVSDDGQVRSLLHGAPRVRVATLASNRYLMVTLASPGGKRRYVTVHSLVAAAFIGPRPPGQEVRHLDANRQNNNVQNLAYGTRSDNAQDMIAAGAHNNARKTHCKNGHEFTPENTRIDRRRDSRICLACRRIADAKYRMARSAA